MSYNQDLQFCYFNTGTTITPTSDKDVYIVSALASFSGDFGTVTLGASQSLNPTVPNDFKLSEDLELKELLPDSLIGEYYFLFLIRRQIEKIQERLSIMHDNIHILNKDEVINKQARSGIWIK
jgi:hypothetical protein